jgi:kinetochore protein NDC80
MSSIGTARFTADPRNIGEKCFMQNSLKVLIAYLSEHGFDHPISLKILTRPAVKDFSNIINFLFRQIDPTFTSTGKFEDDVVTMMKQLGYPFQISKSHITAVGSPHAWPSLLGVIMWLIELLSYDEAAAIGAYIDQNEYDEENIDPDDPSASIKSFYRYTAHSYKLFLAGDDDQFAVLEEKFVQSFDQQNVMVTDQINHLETSIRSLEDEIAEYEKRRAYMPELEAKKKDYMQDLGKFEQLIQQLVQHKDQLVMKTDARKHELNKLNEAIGILDQENESLRQRIAVQELTPEDIRNMVAEKQRLEEAQYAASEIRQQLQRKVWETETELRDKVNALEDSARAYNAIADDLKLIPSTAKNAHGKQLAIEIDIKTKKKSSILKSDVRNEILPVFKEFTLGLQEETNSYRQMLVQQQDVYEDLEMKYQDHESNKQQLESKLRRVEESYRREKESFDHSTEMHLKEMDAIEAKLNKIRDTSADDARYAIAMHKAAEMKVMLENQRKEYEQMKREMIQAIIDVVTMAANHRELAQTSIQDVKDAYSKQLEDFFRQSSMSAKKELPTISKPAQSSSRARTAVKTAVHEPGYVDMSVTGNLSPIHMHSDEVSYARYHLI